MKETIKELDVVAVLGREVPAFYSRLRPRRASVEGVKFIRRPFGGTASKPFERRLKSSKVSISNDMLWSDPL